MASFKLDKTVFKHQTKVQASNQLQYWLSRSVTERLQAAFYLTSVAYNFDINNPPRMDKTAFSIRKRN